MHHIALVGFGHLGLVLGGLAHPLLRPDHRPDGGLPHTAGQQVKAQLVGHRNALGGDVITAILVHGHKALILQVGQASGQFKIIHQLLAQQRVFNILPAQGCGGADQVAQKDAHLGSVGQAARLYAKGKCISGHSKHFLFLGVLLLL